MIRRTTSLAVTAFAIAAISGCGMLGIDGSGSTQDDSGSGGSSADSNIGDFHLALHLIESTCGEGALGLANQWSFDVKLSHEGNVAEWSSGGTAVKGDFDEDSRTLDFTSGVNIDMRTNAPIGQEQMPACTIARADRAIFTLDALQSPRSIDGDLIYTFTPTSNSNCGDLVYGTSPQFAELPCAMHYKVTGAPKSN